MLQASEDYLKSVAFFIGKDDYEKNCDHRGK